MFLLFFVVIFRQFVTTLLPKFKNCRLYADNSYVLLKTLSLVSNCSMYWTSRYFVVGNTQISRRISEFSTGAFMFSKQSCLPTKLFGTLWNKFSAKNCDSLCLTYLNTVDGEFLVAPKSWLHDVFWKCVKNLVSAVADTQRWSALKHWCCDIYYLEISDSAEQALFSTENKTTRAKIQRWFFRFRVEFSLLFHFFDFFQGTSISSYGFKFLALVAKTRGKQII